MNNNYVHIFLTLVLSVLLLLLTDPFMFWMPSMMAMTVLFVAVAAVGVWTGFVVKERVRDEREALHRMHSGRVAYLAGLGVLTVGLIEEGLVEHHVDPWIAGAIWVMVVAKLAARLYFEKHS